ncbi:hypothetical protein C0989_002563 [Termitomyces sp. Mn162]|nr:hypothetical protein C0989_002563 [Termitomyces sp. Mn162]
MTGLHSRHTIRPSHTDQTHANSPPTHSRSWYTPSRMATNHDDKNDVPWHHMADTYSWVVENEYKGNGKTERWILQQQMFAEYENPNRRTATRGSSMEKIWQETVHYKITAGQRMRFEKAQRRAIERERLVNEEIRRIEARLRIKREDERRKIAEERRKTQEAQKERDRRNRLKAEKTVLEAWREYEERWHKLLSSSEALAFSSIPWPVVPTPGKAEDIKPQAVVSFLFSHLHSEESTQKERLRRAQLRWHPDRFQRVLARVKDEDKGKVEEAVGIVARCLNDIKL